MRLAVHVAGEVLGGPAQLEQRLLDLPALGGVHGHGVGVEPRTDERGDLLGPQDLFQHRSVGAGEHQSVHGVLGEGQAAVARHGLGDVDEERVRDGVAGVLDERVDDLLGVMAGGPGVPQAERGDPVGVDVLGSPLQLGEGGDGTPGGSGELVVDFEKEGLVALDDEWTIHARRPVSFRSNLQCAVRRGGWEHDASAGRQAGHAVGGPVGQRPRPSRSRARPPWNSRSGVRERAPRAASVRYGYSCAGSSAIAAVPAPERAPRCSCWIAPIT